MKKSLLSLAVIAVSLSACDTTPKYNINGTITGGEANNVYLLQRQGRTIDTLAKAPVAEGKFKLTGSVAGLTPAFIVVEAKTPSARQRSFPRASLPLPERRFR